jgi:hypothetical protein
MLTSQAKPLTVITKPHDHKTGNRKKSMTIKQETGKKSLTQSSPKVT